MKKILDDEEFAEIAHHIINELLPKLLSELMEWKKPDELPPRIVKVIASITAVSFLLNQYVENATEGEPPDPPNLLN